MDPTGAAIPASRPRQPGGPADSSSCGPLKSRATRGHILPGAPICRTAPVSQRASLLGPGWQLLEKHVFHIKISLEEQWFKPSIKKKKNPKRKRKIFGGAQNQPLGTMNFPCALAAPRGRWATGTAQLGQERTTKIPPALLIQGSEPCRAGDHPPSSIPQSGGDEDGAQPAPLLPGHCELLDHCQMGSGPAAWRCEAPGDEVGDVNLPICLSKFKGDRFKSAVTRLARGG